MIQPITITCSECGGPKSSSRYLRCQSCHIKTMASNPPNPAGTPKGRGGRIGLWWPTSTRQKTTTEGCGMCRLGVLAGHGHKRRNGTHSRKATVRWV